MSNEPNESLEEILFNLAVQKPGPAERAAFLDQVCRENPGLRATLDRLLAVHFGEAGFLPPRSASPAQAEVMSVLRSSAPETPAQLIGHYKLLEKIGEGGFGEVWMAEQREPVKRRVALKIIKLGMDSKQVVARFEAERQALALMDHANIAKIYDAGTTDLGRPYFVMELVRGVRITDYCDQNQLPTRERLELFIKVCHAIQHAHQKGVIHRDIKPTNILVTLHDGVPVPKVIDFGIAKATQQELTDKTVFTHFSQFIGTPAYISPEQAEMSGLDIDTRADIYSLGVLLYELLVGQTPFDAKEMTNAGIDVLRKIIREKEPVRPSTKLSTLPGDARITAGLRRRTDSGRLVHQLRGDLDWIVMKCLEKDRTRRYEAASGLAADLRRHLANEPVVARPPSAVYKLLKAWQRNKVAFTAAAAVALALVAGIGVSTWEALRASRAEALASRRLADSEAARKEAEAITAFLATVFRSPDPARAGRTVTVAETLDRAVKNLDVQFAGQPELRARLQATLAETFLALGMPLEAIPLQEKVRDFHLAAHGPELPATLTALHSLAVSYRSIGRNEEAMSLWEQAFSGRRKVLGPDHSDTLRTMEMLARTRISMGRQKEGLPLLEDVLVRSRQVNGPDHPNTLSVMHGLALFYSHIPGREEEAIQLIQTVVDRRRSQLGAEHAETLRAIGLLADIYGAAGRRDEASKIFGEVMPLLREKYGPGHPTRMDVAIHLGRWSTEWAWADRQTNLPAAHRLARDGEAVLRELLPVYESNTNTPIYHLACARSRLGGALVAVAFTDPALTSATREPKLAEAEAVLLRGQDGIAGDNIFCRRDALERLIRLYETWGKTEKLAEWKRKLADFDQAQAGK